MPPRKGRTFGTIAMEFAPMKLPAAVDPVPLVPTEDERVTRVAGSDRFFEDESLVLPPDFEAPDDLPLPERQPL